MAWWRIAPLKFAECSASARLHERARSGRAVTLLSWVPFVAHVACVPRALQKHACLLATGSARGAFSNTQRMGPSYDVVR